MYLIYLLYSGEWKFRLAFLYLPKKFLAIVYVCKIIFPLGFLEK